LGENGRIVVPRSGPASIPENTTSFIVKTPPGGLSILDIEFMDK
jgi:hypothetical protein